MPTHAPPACAAPHPGGDVLIDPVHLAVWDGLRDLDAQGVRGFHQWGPRDGLDFPAAAPAQQHTVPTLIICLAGQVRVVGRRTRDLQPGEALLLEPGCWHQHGGKPPGTVALELGFIAEHCDLIITGPDGERWGLIPGQPYRAWLDELVYAPGAVERLPLLGRLVRGVLAETVNLLDWRRQELRALVEGIWWHLHEDLAIEAVIARSGLGRTLAFGLLRGFFGRTPKQEVLAQRVALARHLLRRGFSVAEAAQRCGFASRAKLSLAFRQRCGHAPSREPVLIEPRRHGEEPRVVETEGG